MTKPLTFFLQLIGAIFLILGIIPPVDGLKIAFGVILLLIGAYGIRKRMKKSNQ